MDLVPFVFRNTQDSTQKYSVVPEEQRRDGAYDSRKHVLMREMDIESLFPPNCNICYDLHIGNEYVEQRKRGNPIPLKDGDSFIIKPNQAVIIRTKE